jgi:glycosyltransferase involved in cell wall biosynthesis
VKPKIVHVFEALEAGTSRHVVDLVRHVHTVRHFVVAPERRVGSLTDETAIARLKDAGATIHFLPMRRTPWSPNNALALAKLRRHLRILEPDVVHGHASIGGLLSRLAAVGLGRPRVYTAHGITHVRAGRAVERSLRYLTERFVAVSPSQGELVVDLGWIPKERLAVIPNGVDLGPPAPVDLRARLHLSDDAFLVGTVGRLVPEKAPIDFVAASAIVSKAVPNARFVLVGGGRLEEKVASAVEASGLGDRFTLLGSLAGAAGAMGSLDVFVLASLREGGPYTPLEAMSAGTPVVLTDVVGNRDTIEHGVSGLLVPPGDPPALAAAIVELLQDHARRARIGEAGRARVREHFDVKTMAARYEELYASLVADTITR